MFLLTVTVFSCVGALGLTMGMLDGLTEGVGAVLFSQVSMHPVGGFGKISTSKIGDTQTLTMDAVNNIKSALHAADIWRYGQSGKSDVLAFC